MRKDISLSGYWRDFQDVVARLLSVVLLCLPAQMHASDVTDAYLSTHPDGAAPNILFVLDASDSSIIDELSTWDLTIEALQTVLLSPALAHTKVGIMRYSAAQVGAKIEARAHAIAGFHRLGDTISVSGKRYADDMADLIKSNHPTGDLKASGPAAYALLGATTWMIDGWLDDHLSGSGRSNENSQYLQSHAQSQSVGSQVSLGQANAPLNNTINTCANNRIVFISNGEPSASLSLPVASSASDEMVVRLNISANDETVQFQRLFDPTPVSPLFAAEVFAPILDAVNNYFVGINLFPYANNQLVLDEAFHRLASFLIEGVVPSEYVGESDAVIREALKQEMNDVALFLGNAANDPMWEMYRIGLYRSRFRLVRTMATWDEDYAFLSKFAAQQQAENSEAFDQFSDFAAQSAQQAGVCSSIMNQISDANTYQSTNAAQSPTATASQVDHYSATACMQDIKHFVSGESLTWQGLAKDLKPDIPGDQRIEIDTVEMGLNRDETKAPRASQLLEQLATYSNASENRRHQYRSGQAYYIDSAVKENNAASIDALIEVLVNSIMQARQPPLPAADPLVWTMSAVQTGQQPWVSYVPTIQPENRSVWLGNLYKFGLESSEGISRLRLINQNGQPVINAAGHLQISKPDLWLRADQTATPSQQLIGGVAGKLNAQRNRQILTNSGPSKQQVLLPLTTDNQHRVNVAKAFDITLLGASEIDYDDYRAAHQTYTKGLTDHHLATPDNLLIAKNSQYASIRLTAPVNAAIEISAMRLYPNKAIQANQQGGNQLDIEIQQLTAAGWITVYKTKTSLDLSASAKDGYVELDLTSDGLPVIADKILIRSYPTAEGQAAAIHLAEVELYQSREQWQRNIDWFLQPLVQENIELAHDEHVLSHSKMAAPLHTEPVFVDYPAGMPDVVYLPTSEGVLHAFDAETSRELWGFMPADQLGNIHLLRHNTANKQVKDPLFGLDGQPYFFEITDAQQQRRKVLVFGMRRGGYAYYALDISDAYRPTLLWQLNQREDAALEKMGQSWAKPFPARIQLPEYGELVEKNSLVIAGGYDPASDNRHKVLYERDEQQLEDRMGDVVYFVDPLTGALQAVITDSDDQTHYPVGAEVIRLPNSQSLRHGIVAQPASVNLDAERDVDRFYFADTGGDIIRVDFANHIDPSKGNNISAKIMAQFSADSAQTHLRFFHAPSLTKAIIKGKTVIQLVIGSGDYASLRQGASNKFISVYDEVANVTEQNEAPIQGFAELYDASDAALLNQDMGEGNDEHDQLLAKRGWYIDLAASSQQTDHFLSSEKVVTQARIMAGEIRFATLTLQLPTSSPSHCEPATKIQQITKLYAIDIDNGLPTRAEFDGNPASLSIEDRAQETRTRGSRIGAELQVIRTQDVQQQSVTSGDDESQQNTQINDIIVSTKQLCFAGVCTQIQLQDRLQSASWEEIRDPAYIRALGN